MGLRIDMHVTRDRQLGSGLFTRESWSCTVFRLVGAAALALTLQISQLRAQDDCVSSPPPTETCTTDPCPHDFGNATRIALVFGVDTYGPRDGTLPTLVNAINDARDVARMLTSIGFKVRCVLDATKDQARNELKKAKFKVDELVDLLNGGSASDENVHFLIYFAGHGFGEGNATNNIVFSHDFETSPNLRTIYDNAMTTSEVSEDLRSMKAGAHRVVPIIIVDACRTKLDGKRFAKAPNPGSILVFTTQDGEIALDTSKDRFAPTFLNWLQWRNTNFRQIMYFTSSDVRARAAGSELRTPFWVYEPIDAPSLGRRLGKDRACSLMESAVWMELENVIPKRPNKPIFSDFIGTEHSEACRALGAWLRKEDCAQGPLKPVFKTIFGDPVTCASSDLDKSNDNVVAFAQGDEGLTLAEKRAKGSDKIRVQLASVGASQELEKHSADMKLSSFEVVEGIQLPPTAEVTSSEVEAQFRTAFRPVAELTAVNDKVLTKSESEVAVRRIPYEESPIATTIKPNSKIQTDCETLPGCDKTWVGVRVVDSKMQKVVRGYVLREAIKPLDSRELRVKFGKDQVVPSQENVVEIVRFLGVEASEVRRDTPVLVNARARNEAGFDAEEAYAQARVRAGNVVQLLVSIGFANAKVGDVFLAPDDTFPDVIIEVKMT